MTNTAKHTPTPWKTFEGYDATVIRTADRESYTVTPRAVAEVVHHGEHHEMNGERTAYFQANAEDRANAAFIVKAVNAYESNQKTIDQLVKTLRDLASSASVELQGAVSNLEFYIDKAKKALAAVEAQ